MSDDQMMCSEMTTSGGMPLSCRDAFWEEQCRCPQCIEWATHGPGSDDPDVPPVETESESKNPANKPRDETGKFASTALTRSVRGAVAEAGGDEALYGMIESGLSAGEILSTLGLDRSKRGMHVIYRMLNSDPDRYDEAKRISADALAERALDMYGEETPATSADAKWRNDRAGHMRWLAEMRSGFSKDGVNVNVDIGALYLEALRRDGSMERPEPVEVQEAEYEIEDDPEGSED